MLKARNVDIDDELWKQTKVKAQGEDIELRQYVAQALTVANDFDFYAKSHCRTLGWKEGQPNG